MTKKEYESRLADHVQYGGVDFLNSYDKQDLRKEIKARTNNGAFTLEGFNGRATVKQICDGCYVLTSYYTEVAAIIDGQFKKLWQGYSKTTAKHVDIFRNFFGLCSIGKHEWIEMKTETL